MILDRLADATRARYARRMADTPLDIVKSRALALPKGDFAFERALEVTISDAVYDRMEAELKDE